MAIVSLIETSQTFDDSSFFQRLTLIDICCGPPDQAADCQLPFAD